MLSNIKLNQTPEKTKSLKSRNLKEGKYDLLGNN